jgi:hypothetical protein
MEIGWILERNACRAALLGHARGLTGAETLAATTRRAGEVGRIPGLLAKVAASSKSIEEFDRLLRIENFNFLLDPEPSSRVWAYDWLKARGMAPQGYDPLADREERRQALLKTLERKKEQP